MKVGTFIMTHGRPELFRETVASLRKVTGDEWTDIFVLPTTPEDREYVLDVQRSDVGKSIVDVLPVIEGGTAAFNHGEYMDKMARYVIRNGYKILFSLDDDVTFYNDRILGVPEMFEKYPNLGKIGPEWYWDRVARGQYKNLELGKDRLLEQFPEVMYRWMVISFCAFLHADRYAEVGGAMRIRHDGDSGLNVRLKQHGYWAGMTDQLEATQDDRAAGGLQNHSRAQIMVDSRDEMLRLARGDIYYSHPQAWAADLREPWRTPDGMPVLRFKFGREVEAVSFTAFREDIGGEPYPWRPKRLRPRRGETDDQFQARVKEAYRQEDLLRGWAAAYLHEEQKTRAMRQAKELAYIANGEYHVPEHESCYRDWCKYSGQKIVETEYHRDRVKPKDYNRAEVKIHENSSPEAWGIDRDKMTFDEIEKVWRYKPEYV